MTQREREECGKQRIKNSYKRRGCSRVPGRRHGTAGCASKVAGGDAAGGRRVDWAGHIKMMNNVNMVKTSMRLQQNRYEATA